MARLAPAVTCLVLLILAPRAAPQAESGPVVAASFPDAPEGATVEGTAQRLVVTVRNDGDAAIANATVEARALRPGLVVQDPRVVDIGGIPGHTTATVEFRIAAAVAGDHRDALNVQVTRTDGEPVNVTTGLRVLAPARLEVAAPPVRLFAGVAGDAVVTVRNGGDLALHEARVSLRLPAGLVAEDAVDAVIARLDAGAAADAVFRLNASTERTHEVLVNVTSANAGNVGGIVLLVNVTRPLPVVAVDLDGSPDGPSFKGTAPPTSEERRVVFRAPPGAAPFAEFRVVAPPHAGVFLNLTLLNGTAAAEAPPLPADSARLALARIHLSATPASAAAPTGEAMILSVDAETDEAGLPAAALVVFGLAAHEWRVLPATRTTDDASMTLLVHPFTSGLHAAAFRDAEPPTLSDPVPRPASQANASRPLTITVSAFDNTALDKRAVALFVNGEALAGVVYDGRRVTGVLQAGLPPGPVNLTAYARDRFGNEAWLNWSVELVEPAPGMSFTDHARVVSHGPTGTVDTSDVNVTVRFALPPGSDVARITVLMDGRDLSDRALVNRSAVIVPAVPVRPGLHTVVVTVHDTAGGASEHSWEFTVGTTTPAPVEPWTAVSVALAVTIVVGAFIFAVPKVLDRRRPQPPPGRE